MKLAEALLLRADMQKKVDSLRQRIVSNAIVQEGEVPHEDPNQLLREAASVIGELERLVAQINTANLAAMTDQGLNLTQLIARRDALVQQHSTVTAAIAGARREPDRYGVREIKWVATVDVKSLQGELEDLAKRIREINATIQETNWKVEL